MTGKASAGRAEVYSVEEAAARLRLPVTVVQRKLEAPGGPFFRGAWQDRGGAWRIPARALRDWCGRAAEPLYTMQEAADYLRVHYDTLRKRVALWRRGDARQGVAVVDVWGEPRVRESELLRHVRESHGAA